MVALGMLSVTHIMLVLVQNTCMDTNMQFTINSFRQLFPDKIFSLTFSKIPDIFLTAVKFPVTPLTLLITSAVNITDSHLLRNEK